MAWKVVAEGDSFETLDAVVDDFELQRGDRLRVQCDIYGAVFGDLWGAELIWQQMVPDNLRVIDVWAEDAFWPWDKGKIFIELEVLGTPFMAVLGWIIIIGVAAMVGIAIYSAVKVALKVVGTVTDAAPWVIWTFIGVGCAVGGYLGYKWLSNRFPAREPPKQLPEGRG